MKRRVLFVAIEFINKTDLTSATYYFSDAHMEAGSLYSGSPQLRGCLESISGFGVSLGEVLVSDPYGTITLSDDRGSLGADRRVSDLLDRHSAISQAVTVYSIEIPISGAGDSGDLNIEFVGYVASVSISDDSLTLQVKSEQFSSAGLCYLIDDNDVNLSDGRGAGTALPIVFGEDVQVPCVQVDDILDDAVSFAYATAYWGGGLGFPNGDVNQLYAKDKAGDFVAVRTASVANTPIEGAAPTSGFPITPTSALAYYHGIGRRFDNDEGIIIESVRGYFYKTSGATLDKTTSCRIYAFNEDTKAGELLGEASALDNDLASYGTVSGYAVHYLHFTFDSPVVVAPGTPYLVTIVRGDTRDDSTYPVTPFVKGDSGTSGEAYLDLLGSALGDYFYLQSTNTLSVHCQVYGLKLTNYPTGDIYFDEAGRGASYFTLAKRTGSVSDLTKLDLVVAIDGLKDDSSGTITGSGSAQITSASDALALIWHVSGKSLSQLDRSSFSPGAVLSDYPLAGATKGELSARAVISELLTNSCSKLFPLRNGKSAFWTFGSGTLPTHYISEGNCRLESLQIAGLEEIINEISIKYDRREAITAGGSQYAKAGRYNSTRGSEYSTFLGNSEALYGLRSASNEYGTLNFINDISAAERFVGYLFARYYEERLKLEISVPFWGYQSINLLSIISLSHPGMPANAGGAYSGAAKLPIAEDGELAENFANSELWRRARRARLLVVGRSPVWNVGGKEAEIKLTCLELLKREFY
jgi:hypothetical protein